ncbi:SDR family NAD(P)-dependent oxidoreductase [Kiloniella sp.]|uniref:SDR family NAD(P)-dependent oxidoreductase n=1 Tax=Kiloniella sp. TaxID=1938587 RepID=UPI003B01B72D
MAEKSKRALIIGGSSGAGREIALGLGNEGYETYVVARHAEGLDHLKAENSSLETIAIDASKDGIAAGLIKDLSPDLLVLVGGHQPKMAPFHEQSWDEFSATWNNDTKVAYEFSKAALTHPMPTGAKIISFSSGASLGGSALSGGYAGAKRMQHFLVNYAQREADRQDLDLQFISIIPKQLVAGTEIGNEASSAYAASVGKTSEQFMSQWEKPLTPVMIAENILGFIKNGPPEDSEEGANAFTITGLGLEAL